MTLNLAPCSQVVGVELARRLAKDFLTCKHGFPEVQKAKLSRLFNSFEDVFDDKSASADKVAAIDNYEKKTASKSA